MLPVCFSEIKDPVAATGLLGGRTGQFILDHLGEGIEERFFEIAGDTRNCIAILTKVSKQKS